MSTTFVPIMICTGAFLLVAALRYMKHVERMNMIERGGPIEPLDFNKKIGNPYSSAYMILGACIGLLAAIFTTRALGSFFTEDEATGIYFAFIGIGAGVGMLAMKRFDR
jgi:hypothetical protein